MKEFMSSEFYKVSRRKCTKVFFIFIPIMMFLVGLLMRATATGDKTGIGDYALKEFWTLMIFSMGWFLVYMVAQIVHSNESKTGVQKNCVSFGISRTKMYIGRFLVQAILLFVAIVWFAGILYLSITVTLGPISGAEAAFFFKRMACMTFLWYGALAMAHALAMLFNSNSLATTVYCLYFMLGASIIQMLYMWKPDNAIISAVYKNEIYCSSQEFGALKKIASSDVSHMAFVGILWIVLFTVIGLVCYRKKEIK